MLLLIILQCLRLEDSRSFIHGLTNFMLDEINDGTVTLRCPDDWSIEFGKTVCPLSFESVLFSISTGVIWSRRHWSIVDDIPRGEWLTWSAVFFFFLKNRYSLLNDVPKHEKISRNCFILTLRCFYVKRSIHKHNNSNKLGQKIEVH